jgi:LPXTG-motif cell wall-anchored protein
MALKRAFLISLLAAVIALAAGSGAHAQENPDYTAPAPAVEVTDPPVRTAAASPVSQQRATPLALTGSDVLQMVVVGAVLVAGGAGVLAARRRNIA